MADPVKCLHMLGLNAARMFNIDIKAQRTPSRATG
jgi:hypothetical protein